MGPFRRLRLGDQLQVELAELLQHEIRDPRVGFVTVTEVRMSPDLQHARVYVSVLGEGSAQKESLAALESARGYLKSQIGRRLKLRHVPELRFVLDDTLATSARIDTLLDEAERGRQSEPDDDE